MSKQREPEIAVELGGKIRHLRVDINALATFEEITGLNLLKPSVQKELEEGMTISQVRAFLYACLVHEDASLTLTQVGSFITVRNMEEVMSRIAEAKEIAAPQGKGDEDTAPLPTKKSRRSSSSGRSGVTASA